MSIFRSPFPTFPLVVFFNIIIIHGRAEQSASLLLYTGHGRRVYRHVFITNSTYAPPGGAPLCARRVRMRNRCGVPRVSGRSTGSVVPKILATTTTVRNFLVRKKKPKCMIFIYLPIIMRTLSPYRRL